MGAMACPEVEGMRTERFGEVHLGPDCRHEQHDRQRIRVALLVHFVQTPFVALDRDDVIVWRADLLDQLLPTWRRQGSSQVGRRSQ